jgi:putative membrane protein
LLASTSPIIVPALEGSSMAMAMSEREQRIFQISRPEPKLLTLYLLYALCTLIFFPIVFVPLWIRYATLRYRFTEEGVGKSHGLLFKHEDLVQYARIQDLHLSRNLFQRWLGLATIEIQTASGSAGAELTVEGLSNYDELRDFLYSKMRGVRFGEGDEPAAAAGEDEATALLTQIRDEIRLLRSQRP